MNSAPDDWAPRWVIGKNLGFDDEQPVACRRVGGHVVEVDRPGLPSVRVSYFSSEWVDEGVVAALLAEDPGTRALFNVERHGLVTQEGYAAAQAAGVPILRFVHSPAALGVADPADYVANDNVFVKRGLRRHRAVGRVVQIGQSDYELTSTRGERLVVCVRDDYEVSAASVRRTIDAFPDVDVYVTSNPNAMSISPEADAAGEWAGVLVFLWADFMGFLRGPWK